MIEVVVLEWVSNRLAQRWSAGLLAIVRTAIRCIKRRGDWALLYWSNKANVVEACIIEVLGVDMCSALKKHSCQGALGAHKTLCARKQ